MDQMEKTLMFYQDIIHFLLKPCSESDQLLSLTWKNSSFRNPNGGDVMNTLTYEFPRLYIINIYWVIMVKYVKLCWSFLYLAAASLQVLLKISTLEISNSRLIWISDMSTSDSTNDMSLEQDCLMVKHLTFKHFKKTKKCTKFTYA